MRLALAALAACALVLTACAPSPLKGIDQQQLADKVASAVGDPSTCVLIADSRSGHVLWRSALPTVCDVKHARCVRAGTASPYQVLRELHRGAELAGSCTTDNPGESVGWAAGHAGADLSYVAVMESDRALPGDEIRARLLDAFAQSGIGSP